MTYYDKSDHVGYDERDKATVAELEAMLERTPEHLRRNLQHRIHDGIMQRLKEEGAKKCWMLIEQLDRCVSTTAIPMQRKCYPYRDALNECYHEINTEDNYQKYRIMYLRGELSRINSERLAARVEGMKRQHPESLSQWKLDYADKLVHAYQDIGLEPLPGDNVVRDDLAGKGTDARLD
jgi:COX assembly protein 1